MASLLEDLKFRGLLYQVTNEAGLSQELSKGPISLYAGYDPTADSLTVGNLLSIVLLMRFQRAGHKPIALVGGGTGLIGDPSGKSQERGLHPAETVEVWSQKIRRQLERFLDFKGSCAAQLINNYEWLGSWRVIEFLRDTGKHFPLTQMLHKESVQSRMEVGISFTEFSYMLLQAYDFKQLFERHACRLQVGGSDQWGNITAGCELVRRTSGKEVFGLTTPIVTKADGTKFGKSESGTLWLDSDKTSAYQWYQFWINTGDKEVSTYLKYFTFLSQEELSSLEEAVQKSPEKREAQKRLAEEMTKLVHGQEALDRAKKISEAFFGSQLASLNQSELEEALKDVPSVSLPAQEEPFLVDLLVQLGASASKRQAREDIGNKAVYLVGEAVELDPQKKMKREESNRLFGKYSILRRGKKNHFLVRWV